VPSDNAAPVSALSACLASKCESACGLTCGGFAGYLSMPDAAAGCEGCLEKSACSNERACGSSVECDAFWRCYLACQTPDCQWACARDNDGGAGLFRALYQDFSSSTCATQCGYGSYWACAGHVKWPNAKPGSPSRTWWVYDFQGGSVPNAQVSVCVNGTGPGCPCSAPGSRMLAQGRTDPNGYITLSFQQDLTPTGGGSTACVETQAPGYLTTFTTSAFPAVESVWSISDALVPRQALGIILQTPEAEQTYYSLVNATFDPTVASVLGVGVYDCLGSPAPGVEVYASIGGTPIADASADEVGIAAVFTDSGVTGGTSNSPGGRVVFFDVPFGSVAVTAIVPGVGIVGALPIATLVVGSARWRARRRSASRSRRATSSGCGGGRSGAEATSRPCSRRRRGC